MILIWTLDPVVVEVGFAVTEYTARSCGEVVVLTTMVTVTT